MLNKKRVTDIKKHKGGFTLIELIVVIAVIAILASVMLPRFTGFTESARKTGVLSDARNIVTVVEAMMMEGTTLTDTAVMNYVGKAFGGDLDVQADGDFTYIKYNEDGKYYTITYTYSTSVLSDVTVSPTEPSGYDGNTTLVGSDSDGATEPNS
jgi:type IV pilus assembly protein PilA